MPLTIDPRYDHQNPIQLSPPTKFLKTGLEIIHPRTNGITPITIITNKTMFPFFSLSIDPPYIFFIYYITKFPYILVVIEQKNTVFLRCSKKLYGASKKDSIQFPQV